MITKIYTTFYIQLFPDFVKIKAVIHFTWQKIFIKYIIYDKIWFVIMSLNTKLTAYGDKCKYGESVNLWVRFINSGCLIKI